MTIFLKLRTFKALKNIMVSLYVKLTNHYLLSDKKILIKCTLSSQAYLTYFQNINMRLGLNLRGSKWSTLSIQHRFASLAICSLLRSSPHVIEENKTQFGGLMRERHRQSINRVRIVRTS